MIGRRCYVTEQECYVHRSSGGSKVTWSRQTRSRQTRVEPSRIRPPQGEVVQNREEIRDYRVILAFPRAALPLWRAVTAVFVISGFGDPLAIRKRIQEEVWHGRSVRSGPTRVLAATGEGI